MNTWFFGLHAKPIKKNVHQINVTGYGPANVGPYAELKNFVGRNSGLECHHIVEVEHLNYFKTFYINENAPSIAFPESLHRSLISPRFTAEMNAFGGRRGGMAQKISVKEILNLYKQVYTWHTPFRELFIISNNILR